jgi:hypothetical protein
MPPPPDPYEDYEQILRDALKKGFQRLYDEEQQEREEAIRRYILATTPNVHDVIGGMFYLCLVVFLGMIIADVLCGCCLRLFHIRVE